MVRVRTTTKLRHTFRRNERCPVITPISKRNGATYPFKAARCAICAILHPFESICHLSLICSRLWNHLSFRRRLPFVMARIPLKCRHCSTFYPAQARKKTESWIKNGVYYEITCLLLILSTSEGRCHGTEWSARSLFVVFVVSARVKHFCAEQSPS